MFFGLLLIGVFVVILRRHRRHRGLALMVAFLFASVGLELTHLIAGWKIAALAAAAIGAYVLYRRRIELDWAVNRLRDCPACLASAPAGFLLGVGGGLVAIYGGWRAMSSPDLLVLVALGAALMFLGQWSMTAPSRLGSWRWITSLPYRVLREGQGAFTEDLGEARHVLAVMIPASIVGWALLYCLIWHPAPPWLAVLSGAVLIERFAVAMSAVEVYRARHKIGGLVAIQRRELAEHLSQYPPQRGRAPFAWYRA